MQIFTSANTAAASNQQSLANERAAAAATSCSAQNTGASSSASQVTAVQFQSSSGVQVSSVAYAACAAGINIPASGQDSGSSSSGSQASINGVSASVTCDGTMIRNTKSSTTFIVQVKGSYCQGVGFRGAVAGQRVGRTLSSPFDFTRPSHRDLRLSLLVSICLRTIGCEYGGTMLS